MKIRFWGTRGSIPVSLTAKDIRAKLITAIQGAQGLDLSQPGAVDTYVDNLGFETTGTFGGHSSCVQIITGGPEHVILDLGSGVRPLGQAMLEQYGAGQPQTYHIFMSHLHWDHIMGFPFFTPAYIPGNRIVIHSCHAQVEHAFRRQQDNPSFPVGFDIMGADIRFDVLQPGQSYDIAGMRVTAHLQRHAGDSYGWRFEHQGVRAVYTTDSEHHVDDEAERQGFIDFFQGADAVIFDAMYSLVDTFSVKEDWGHSSNIVGVELCQAAKARRLVMFHHEPAYNDAQIAQVLVETRRFEEITRDDHAVEILSAWDGLELTL
jgi:phosphoribosyl 1,2-cyclic phosphodiesterase